ncbi:MAG TPA: hypothetical protein VNA21_03050 [Steroidobacteraceae bacterium]|nr:hypothetical protein [Steroidobacteraceae bacterium]
MRRHAALLTWISIALCACALPSAGTEDAAAFVAAPSAATRAELQRSVNALLGKNVMLADDALTQSSVLVIERSAVRDPTGRRVEARETQMPDRLRLIKRGADCVLINESTQQEAILRNVACKQASPVQ